MKKKYFCSDCQEELYHETEAFSIALATDSSVLCDDCAEEIDHDFDSEVESEFKVVKSCP